jgi:hypothetical protein
MIYGQNPSKESRPVQTDADGKLLVSLSGGGGDASAENQVEEQVLIGAVDETAPASDTASSGLNGRLQRIAQRLTSLIALLPASLGIKTAAASLSVAPASDASFVVAGGVAAAATDSGNPVKTGGKYNSTLPVYTNGQRGDTQIDARGSARVAIMSADGIAGATVSAASIDAYSGANAALWTIGTGYIWNGATWDRVVKPNAVSRLLTAAASTNATSVKGSAGNVFKIVVGANTNAADRFLKLYNKATAPTVGTDTPVLTFLLPLTSKNIVIDLGSTGHYFSTGIAYALTTAAADADTGAVSSGDITCMNITYS